MQDYANILGAGVKQARLDLKLSQFEVADQINADDRTILNIEHCKGNPKLEILWPLIRALKIDANTIFYPETQNRTSTQFQMQQFISQCSETEVKLLLNISQTIINTLRNRQISPHLLHNHHSP